MSQAMHESPAAITGRLDQKEPCESAAGPLTPTELNDAYQRQSATHYLDLFSIVKAATLGVAGLALAKIPFEEPSAHQHVYPHIGARLALWLVAFESAVLGYCGPITGAALIRRRPGIPDIVAPMMLSVAEFVLVFRPSEGLEGNGMPQDWFFCLATWELLSVVNILIARAAVSRTVYSPTLEPIASLHGESRGGVSSGNEARPEWRGCSRDSHAPSVTRDPQGDSPSL